jgi:hypothetical protein
MLEKWAQGYCLSFLCSVNKIDLIHQAVYCSHTSWLLLMCTHHHVHTTVMYWLCKESGTLVAMALNLSMEANSSCCFSVKTTWHYSFCSHWKICTMVSQKFHVFCANSSDPSLGGDIADLLHGTSYSWTTRHLLWYLGTLATEQIHSRLELFIAALLDVMDGLLYVVLFSPVPLIVLPINLLHGLSKGLEDFCWWALCMGCQKVTPL